MKAFAIVVVVLCALSFLACGGCFVVFLASVPRATPEQMAENKQANKAMALKQDAERSTRECITDVLKAPTTAKFNLQSKHVQMKVVLVNGTVTAQNSFGAMLTQQVQAVFFVNDKGLPSIAMVSLDGKRTHEDKQNLAACEAILKPNANGQ